MTPAWKVDQGIFDYHSKVFAYAVALAQIEYLKMNQNGTVEVHLKSGSAVDLPIDYREFLKIWIDHSHWR